MKIDIAEVAWTDQWPRESDETCTIETTPLFTAVERHVLQPSNESAYNILY